MREPNDIDPPEDEECELNIAYGDRKADRIAWGSSAVLCLAGLGLFGWNLYATNQLTSTLARIEARLNYNDRDLTRLEGRVVELERAQRRRDRQPDGE